MPSDPSGRHPLGVLSRIAPDWFDDNVGTASYFNAGVSGSYTLFDAIALYNNDTQARALKVYGLTVGSDGGNGYTAYWVNGLIATPLSNAYALRPDLPMPPGQICAISTHATSPVFPYPYTFAPIVASYGVDGFDSATYFSPFPMAIVPPGWSYVLTNILSSLDTQVSFWFQASNE